MKSPQKTRDKSLKSPYKLSRVTLIRADPVTCEVLVLLTVNAPPAFLIRHKTGREKLKENIDKDPARSRDVIAPATVYWTRELNTFVLAHLEKQFVEAGPLSNTSITRAHTCTRPVLQSPARTLT